MKMHTSHFLAFSRSIAILAWMLVAVALSAPTDSGATKKDPAPESKIDITVAEDGNSLQRPRQEATRILILGDSLSSAYGLKREQGWVALVGQRLLQDGLDAQMINASIAGETTRGGLYRLPNLLAEHRPQIVIVGLGANDGLRGLSLKKLAANLDRIVQLCLEDAGAVILAAIPLTANYGSYVLDLMHEHYRDVSARHGIAMIDFFGHSFIEDPDYYQDDRLHPNAKAQELIADIFWPEIIQTVRAIQ